MTLTVGVDWGNEAHAICVLDERGGIVDRFETKHTREGLARKRGCDHPHAVRILARAWIRALWRCWKDGVLYDPSRHGGACRLDQAA